MKKNTLIYIITLLLTSASLSFAETKCIDIPNLDNYSDAELQQILKACEKEIEENKKILSEKKQKTQNIQRDISILNTQIRQNQARIRARNIEIYRLKQNINNQAAYISKLEKEITDLKKKLSDLIRLKYRLSDYSLVEIMLSKENLSDFFSDSEYITKIETQITQSVDKYKKLKQEAQEKTEEYKEAVAREKELIEKKQQELNLVKNKKLERDILLAQAKKEQKKYEKLIAEKEAIKAKIRNRIFRVASGEKITFGEALDLISPFEKYFSFDAAFLLSVLFQESGWGGKIGGNIGQCKYNQYNPYGNAKNGYQVMSKRQIPAFLQIMRGLGKDPTSVPVSCPIPTDGAYGGAMGPAQFIPTTWLSVRARAAQVLGKSPQAMSPFANQDAFIASAVYLNSLYNSKSCTNYANKYKHIAPVRTLKERCAASMYYAGSNWWKFRFKYGESVVRRANKFRADIQTLRQ